MSQSIPAPTTAAPAATATTAPPATDPAAVDQELELGEGAVATDDPKALKAELESARKQAGQYRSQLRKLEEKARLEEEAKLTETELLKKRVAELEATAAEAERKVQETALRSATLIAAGKLGFADPAVAWRLLDQAEVKLNAEGEPTNIEALLGDLVKTMPALVVRGGGSANPGPQGVAPPATNMNDALRRAAGRGV